MKKLFLLLPLLVFLFIPRQVWASPLSPNDINLHSWTQISSLDIVSGLNCQITGYDPTKPDGSGCVSYDQNGQLAMADKPGGGAVAFAGNLIAALYTNPPASSGQYFADLGRNLGIVKPAYAAEGFGFSRLSFLLPIWKVFRDITYIFFVIVFIAIGFAIMFRMKISPQAVVTIQAAIPRIVLALLLVTFSYAIASLLIDFMYVITLLVLGALQQAGLGGVAVDPNGGFFELLKDVFKASGNWGKGIFGIGGLVGIVGLLMAFFGVVPGLGVVLGIAGGLIALVFSIILLYVILKTFFSLLGSYIAILFAIILGPFQIMLGAIPGQSGFGGWFRNLIANIAVFPAVAIFLYISSAIIKQSTLGQPVWAPPLVGGSLSAILPFILGFGMLLLLPKVPDMVKDAFKVPAFKYGSAIGEAIGPVAGPIRGGVRGYGAHVGGELDQPGAAPWKRIAGQIVKEGSKRI
ncbi:MAG: hypothetical protein Q8Q15_01930 [bacterium]|nr:hypothetical protein [bacterium]